MSDKKEEQSFIMAAGSDPASPYFLHHSDNPGTILVSQLLTEDNYPAWSRAMIISLSSKNKLGFIDGTVARPVKNSADFVAWERCNTMVLSWIWNSVSKELTSSVIYLDTAKEVWEDLKERFSPSNSIQIYHIKRAISNHAQNDLSVAKYYTILKGYWDELGSLVALPVCGSGISRDYLDYQQ
jgi:gag-polypeptide of LTR copia-type